MCSINRTAGPLPTIHPPCSTHPACPPLSVPPPRPAAVGLRRSDGAAALIRPAALLLLLLRACSTYPVAKPLCVTLEPAERNRIFAFRWARRRGKCYLCQLIQPVVARRPGPAPSLPSYVASSVPVPRLHSPAAALPPNRPPRRAPPFPARTPIGKIGGFAVTVRWGRTWPPKICFSQAGPPPRLHPSSWRAAVPFLLLCFFIGLFTSCFLWTGVLLFIATLFQPRFPPVRSAAFRPWILKGDSRGDRGFGVLVFKETLLELGYGVFGMCSAIFTWRSDV